jgi:internalin A
MKKIALLALVVILTTLLTGCAGEEADQTPPVISGISASSVTESSATIDWITDEPATSQVEYGLTTSYGSTATSPLDALVTSHSVSLSGLDPSTTYHYRVKSKDESDNEAVSGDHSFTTSKIFPDENLEAAVREAIGKPEGALLISDLEGLTSLDASGGWNIADLTGLEHCTSLTELDLSWNQLSDLSPLSGLTSLTVLHLSWNQISDVSVLSGLTSLTELDLSDNQISDLTPLQELTNLTSLNLGGNQISDITPLVDNEGLSAWDTVDLRVNPLSAQSLNTSIPQLEARGVEVLYCGEPQAVTFPDANLEAAIREAIGKPEGPIDICDLERLTSLYAANRNIADLTGLEHCINLTSLTLSMNPLSDISALSGLTSLTYLNLSGNQISDILPLSGLTSLTWLNLSGNQISDILPLSGLTSLTVLVLEHNPLSDISPLSGLTSLTDLWLSYNQISNVSPLSGLTSLTVLHLSGNQISDITPLVDNEGLSAGDTLELWGDPLSAESLSVLIPQLQDRGVEVLY